MDTQFVAMLTACAQRDQAGLEAAIAQGADINRAAEDGSTALLAACSCGFSSGVEYLFNHPDSTDDAHNQRMADGRNTLFLAVQSGDHGTVEIVLRKAAVPPAVVLVCDTVRPPSINQQFGSGWRLRTALC